eukprot:191935_1
MNTTSSGAGASTGVNVAPATIDEALISDKVGGATKSKDSFVRGLFQALLKTTKVSNALPTGDDAEYASTYPSYKKEAEESSRDVLELLSELLCQATNKEGVVPSTSLLLASKMHSLDEIDPELFEYVFDVVDGLLVDVEIQLEEAKGNKSGQQSSHMMKALSLSSDIPKPQKKFTVRLDNARVEGIKRKTIAEDLHEAHLRAFCYKDWQLKPPDKEQSLSVPLHIPDSPHPVPSNIEATFVDTEEGLDALICELQKESQMEMAIDLENHSFRSFQGICCLMQITISSGDYIIDTLALRSALPRLRVPFSNPSLVKVVHGCNSDVLWLQRDFGLYLVNIFDTGQAARELGLPSFGLSYLLSTYCDIQVNKAHQLSDWRLRPLTDSMLRYAQRDTHYLLYLHGVLRKKLWDRDGQDAVLRVLDSSKELCHQCYRVPQFDPDGWLKVMYRQPMIDDLSSIGRRVMARLWEWRDRVARVADESVGYVMSLQLMLRIARSLPSSSDAINCCGNPLPPLTRENSSEVLSIVSECTAMEEDRGVVNQTLDSQMQHSNFIQDTTTVAAPYGGNTSSSSEIADVLSSTMMETEELYRIAGWDPPIPSTECNGKKMKPRLSAGNAGMGATLKMTHSLGLGDDETLSDGGDYNIDKGREKAQQIRDEIANEPILSLQNAPDLVIFDEMNNNEMMKGEQRTGREGDVLIEEGSHYIGKEDKKGDGAAAAAQSPGGVHKVAGNIKDEKDHGKCKRQKCCGDTTIREPKDEDTLQFVENIIGITPQDWEARVASPHEVFEGTKGMTSASNGVPFTTTTTTMSSPMEGSRASEQPQQSPQTSSPL